MFTKEQRFIKQYKDGVFKDSLRFYYSCANGLDKSLSDNRDEVVGRVIFPRTGAFKAFTRTKTVGSASQPIGVVHAGNPTPGTTAPISTGKSIPIIKTTDDVTYDSGTFSVFVCGYTNNAAGFFVRIGEDTPGTLKGKIEIDTTNISLTLNDGTLLEMAHGVTIADDTFYCIGGTWTLGALVNKTTNSGTPPIDLTTALEFGADTMPTDLGGRLTVEDTYEAGIVGTNNNVYIQGILCFMNPDSAIGTVMDRQVIDWYQGHSPLHGDVTSL